MRKDAVIFGILVILIIFTIIQTIQVYQLKKSFNEIKKISKELSLKNGEAIKDVQKESSQIPESLRELPSVIQGCFS